MRQKCRKLALVLCAAATCAPVSRAAQRDLQIELMETTYRVLDHGSGEIVYHSRLRALTAEGRSLASQIHVNYNSGFQDVEFKFVKTRKKDGTMVSGDPAAAFDTPSFALPLAPYFSDLKSRTVIPPSVDTGDTVEYEAVIHQHQWEI